MSDLTKEELDDIFYQGGPLEEEWEESDYDEAIRRVHDESIAAATPHIRAALFNELIERAGNEWERVRKEDPWSPSPAWDITQWLVEQKKQETQP